MTSSYVYEIVDGNGRCHYVGKADGPARRWVGHRSHISRRKMLGAKKRRLIVCLNDPETGGEREFLSGREAERFYRVHNVFKVCNRVRETVKGLRFCWK